MSILAATALSRFLAVIIIVIPGPEPGGPPAAPNSPVDLAPLTEANGETIKVSDAAALTQALAAAKPGQTIELADGTYTGQFAIKTAGQEGSPITLKGSRRALIDGGGTGTGYVLHLVDAHWWQLDGFTVTGLEKGVMVERTNHAILSDLDVGNTGAEAVHFYNFSSDNTIQNSYVHDTGKTKPQFGEGIYFGTAKSNWAKKSGGQPDKSDNNRALANTFAAIAAENIDVKEETSGGVIAGNRFDGSAISGQNFADSVLDIKGTRYTITGNLTTGASAKLVDGFQTHVITNPETSGCENTFADNKFDGVTFHGGQEIALDKRCDGATGVNASPESEG